MSYVRALEGLARGTTYILDNKGNAPPENLHTATFHKATFSEKFYRFYDKAYANEQDKKVAKILAKALIAKALIANPLNTQLLKTSDAFAKSHKTYKAEEYTNLQNAVFAIKCAKKTSLKVNELVNNDGSAKGEDNLVKFLNVNKFWNIEKKLGSAETR